MNNKKAKLAKYLIPSVVGIALAVGVGYYCFTYLYPANGYTGSRSDLLIMAVADGALIPGVLYSGFGVILWIASTGVLDIIGYGFRSLVYLFTLKKKSRAEGGFYEYKLRQKEKRKEVPIYILWIGLAFIGLSAILNIVFMV